MPEYRVVMVEDVAAPEEPMRDSSFFEGLEELISDIAENGLINPPALEEYDVGKFRVIAGHRRTYAVQQLQWPTFPAMVYQPGEADADSLMGAENFQRSEVDPVEEGRFFLRMINDRGMSQAEVARRFKRNPSRIHALLSIVSGDENVLQEVKDGRISIAQGVEINRVQDEGGRKMFLHYAIHDGLAAQYIRLERERREASGIQQTSEQIQEMIDSGEIVDTRIQRRCYFCEEYKAIEECIPRIGCAECFGAIMSWREAYLTLHPEDGTADQNADGVTGNGGEHNG